MTDFILIFYIYQRITSIWYIKSSVFVLMVYVPVMVNPVSRLIGTLKQVADILIFFSFLFYTWTVCLECLGVSPISEDGDRVRFLHWACRKVEISMDRTQAHKKLDNWRGKVLPSTTSVPDWGWDQEKASILATEVTLLQVGGAGSSGTVHLAWEKNGLVGRWTHLKHQKVCEVYWSFWESTLPVPLLNLYNPVTKSHSLAYSTFCLWPALTHVLIYSLHGLCGLSSHVARGLQEEVWLAVLPMWLFISWCIHMLSWGHMILWPWWPQGPQPHRLHTQAPGGSLKWTAVRKMLC